MNFCENTSLNEETIYPNRNDIAILSPRTYKAAILMVYNIHSQRKIKLRSYLCTAQLDLEVLNQQRNIQIALLEKNSEEIKMQKSNSYIYECLFPTQEEPKEFVKFEELKGRQQLKKCLDIDSLESGISFL